MGAVSQDFVCGICKHVAREPQLTSCCGETVCKACVTLVLEDKKPCQSCETAEFSVSLNIKYQRRILALEVCCTVKDRGCEWSGKLEDLEAHLDAKTGDCEYADVTCPNECDQPVEKHDLSSHLTSSCPKREFTCQYCNFKATYEVVSNDHWPQCSFYPVPCPNACGIQAIERGDIEAHLLQCPLETVECDFLHAGCSVGLVRKDLEKHMEENTQKHVALVPALTLKTDHKHDQLQRKLENVEKQQEQLQKQHDELQKKTYENEAKIKDLEQQLQQKAKRAEELGDVIEMPNFEQYKDDQAVWYSPPRYTHPGGYKFGIAVIADAGTEGYSNNMAVYCYSMRGSCDNLLKWPVKFTITLELLNQERNQGHIAMTKRLSLSQIDAHLGCVIVITAPPYSSIGVNSRSIHTVAHQSLQQYDKAICYLKNDCLLFRIIEVKVR